MSIQVPPGVGTSGQLVDALVFATTAQRQVMTIGDPASSGSLAPVTTSAGMLVHISSGVITSTATTITSGTITLSSAIAISSGTITSTATTITSGTVTLSSAIAISSGTITATAATNPWSSAPGFNVPTVNASSGHVGVLPSTGTLYSAFVFNASSSNSLISITTAAAILYGWNVGNTATSAALAIRTYNSTTASAGSTTNLTGLIPVPGGSAGGGNNLILPQGVSYASGITMIIAQTFNATSTATNHSAGDVSGVFYYRT